MRPRSPAIQQLGTAWEGPQRRAEGGGQARLAHSPRWRLKEGWAPKTGPWGREPRQTRPWTGPGRRPQGRRPGPTWKRSIFNFNDSIKRCTRPRGPTRRQGSSRIGALWAIFVCPSESSGDSGAATQAGNPRRGAGPRRRGPGPGGALAGAGPPGARTPRAQARGPLGCCSVASSLHATRSGDGSRRLGFASWESKWSQARAGGFLGVSPSAAACAEAPKPSHRILIPILMPAVLSLWSETASHKTIHTFPPSPLFFLFFWSGRILRIYLFR